MVCKVIFVIVFALLVLAAYLLRCMWKEMKEQERENLKLRSKLACTVECNCVLVLQRDSLKAAYLNTKKELKSLLNRNL